MRGRRYLDSFALKCLAALECDRSGVLELLCQLEDARTQDSKRDGSVSVRELCFGRSDVRDSHRLFFCHRWMHDHAHRCASAR